MPPVHLDRPPRPAVEHAAPPRKPSTGQRAGVIAVIGALITISVSLPPTRLSTLASINVMAVIPPSTSPPPPPRTTGPPLPSVAAVGTVASSKAPEDPGVHSSGSLLLSVEHTWGLSLRQEGNWSLGPVADLTVTHGLLAAGNGSGITHTGSRPPHPAQCEHLNNAGPYLLGAQLPSGTHLCVKTRDGLVGAIRVDYRTNADGEIEDVLLTGAVWRSR
ncbi:hypothetical protein ACWGE0_04610 [Lentzea sp. NPDC054927]